jgi:hypothetical protein
MIQVLPPAKANAGDTYIYQYRAADKKWFKIK